MNFSTNVTWISIPSHFSIFWHCLCCIFKNLLFLVPLFRILLRCYVFFDYSNYDTFFCLACKHKRLDTSLLLLGDVIIMSFIKIRLFFFTKKIMSIQVTQFKKTTTALPRILYIHWRKKSYRVCKAAQYSCTATDISHAMSHAQQ